MSKIVNLKEYDLVLTYTWYANNNHGICGHTFEVLEYFWILKDYFNVCILISDDISKKNIEESIKSKYNFTANEIEFILNHTKFHLKPKVVLCRKILFTDGAAQRIMDEENVKIFFDKMFLFACGYIPIKDNKNKDIFVLQDHRVYTKAKVNSVEYRKKMLFSKFKTVKTHQNRTLIYATKNCRGLTDEYYYNLLEKYNDDFLVLTNTENTLTFNNDRITQIQMPVPNIFEQFNKYIYTPISRQFDCSPRFIAECKHYGIEVIYDIDYIDKGLEARRADMKNMSTINLCKKDDIINIIKGH